MGATTYSPNAVAREVSKAVGRAVTDKQVRSMARAIIARFDKVTHPAYQSHDYTAQERTTLVAAFRAKAKGQPVAKAKTRTRRAARVAKTTTTSAE